MSQQQLEYAKKQLESRMGRPLTDKDVTILKGVYYFGKSYRPAERKSEPQAIGEVLPGVVEQIRSRCNRRRKKHGLPLLGPDGAEHGSGVFKAMAGFMKNRPEQRGARKVKRW